MKNKCQKECVDSARCRKYESLFIFGDEEKLQEHIQSCPDCREMHEKMQRVSVLVKEAKPHYKGDTGKKRTIIFSTMCASFLLFVALFGGGKLYQDNENLALLYDTSDSVISEMGFPVDEYGFLKVD